jgi:Uma2 family endonuclease
MSSAFKLLPYYTYEDYIRWEGQWELIDGIPYAMSPMPRPEHQAVAGNLHAELRAAIKKAGCNCKVYQPIDYKVTEDTVLNPDILVVCQPIVKQYLDFPPDIVVEVLSKSTYLKDRHTKFEIYQKEQIPYYIMIGVEEKSVEVYQLQNKEYVSREVKQQEAFHFFLSHCQFDLVFESVWS